MHKVEQRPILPASSQFVRFAAIGIASNVVGYLIYLLITWLGVPPKVAMTLLYLVGATLGFLGNRRFTFFQEGALVGPALRYALAHCGGYAVNLAIQVVMVDRWQYSHQIAQALAVAVVALYLFVALKYAVFTSIGPRRGDQP